MTDLDPDRLAEVARAAIEAMDALAGEATRLAAAETEGNSPDKRVQVRVTPAGRLVRIRLRDGVLRRYDSSQLSELVTRTVRDAQRRARAEYERAMAAIEAPELAASEAELNRIWRE
jgi:DNA-binding protein YbaB